MGCISGIMKVMNDKSNSHRFPTELNVLMFEWSFCDVECRRRRGAKFRRNNNNFELQLVVSVDQHLFI